MSSTVTIVETVTEVVEVDEENVVVAEVSTTETVELGIEGPQGPPGPASTVPGPAGPPGPSGGSYRHVQSSAAAVWTVVHNLGFLPGGIYVEDSAHREMRPRITHVDTTTLTLSFFVDGAAVAEAGEAYIS